MTYIDIALTIITLTTLEIFLGIDNLIFLSILTEKLPSHVRRRARHLGLSLAWVTRLLLLFFAVCLVTLNQPLFTFKGTSFSIHGLFLIAGGFFLIAKATQEIHYDVDKPKNRTFPRQHKGPSFWKVVTQVALMDVVFSLDSVLTAIGLTSIFWIMAVAITISILMMIYLSASIAQFIERNPTIKILALCFLLLIGILLISDGFSFHIPREYLYVVMGFSLLVEFLNFLKKR